MVDLNISWPIGLGQNLCYRYRACQTTTNGHHVASIVCPQVYLLPAFSSNTTKGESTASSIRSVRHYHRPYEIVFSALPLVLNHRTLLSTSEARLAAAGAHRVQAHPDWPNIKSLCVALPDVDYVCRTPDLCILETGLMTFISATFIDFPR